MAGKRRVEPVGGGVTEPVSLRSAQEKTIRRARSATNKKTPAARAGARCWLEVIDRKDAKLTYKENQFYMFFPCRF